MVYGGLYGPWSPSSVCESEFHRQVVRKELRQEHEWAMASMVRDALLQSGSTAKLDALSEARLKQQEQQARSTLSRSGSSAKSLPIFVSATQGWSGKVPARWEREDEKSYRHRTSSRGALGRTPTRRRAPPAARTYASSASHSLTPLRGSSASSSSSGMLLRPSTPPPYHHHRASHRAPPSSPIEMNDFAAAAAAAAAAMNEEEALYTPPWKSSSRSPARAESPVAIPSTSYHRLLPSRTKSSQLHTIGAETARWRAALTQSSLHHGLRPLERPRSPSPPPALLARPPSVNSPETAAARAAAQPAIVRPKPRHATRTTVLSTPHGGLRLPSAAFAAPHEATASSASRTFSAVQPDASRPSNLTASPYSPAIQHRILPLSQAGPGLSFAGFREAPQLFAPIAS